MLCSKGTVSSKMNKSLFFLFTITISGFKFWTKRSSGMVPPVVVLNSGISANTSNLLLSTEQAIQCIILSCLHVNLPWFGDTGQAERTCTVFSLPFHSPHLSVTDFLHCKRFASVGRVSSVELRMNLRVPLFRL